ncbi:hypothetical protein AV530_011932 [Patagioenas fasciata monilis]|uniref:Uncharacterized protein n=1 Tax=Patagioenas fasciata monilis TaxID=372326 RepID=A0A1V4JU77_PATFA|nr:hypothetical protein AV530_011932 [Patagioenas fasciata monilis]
MESEQSMQTTSRCVIPQTIGCTSVQLILPITKLLRAQRQRNFFVSLDHMDQEGTIAGIKGQITGTGKSADDASAEVYLPLKILTSKKVKNTFQL